MKLIIENWRQFVNEEEQEEKSNVLDLGKEFNVPNDYSKKIKRGDVSPTAKFKKDYIGKITGQDISRQHYPPKMYESIQKWSNYFYGVLSE